MTQSYEYDPFDVFDIKRRDNEVTLEHLAVTLEITIALPQKDKHYRCLSLPEKVNVYKNLWSNFCCEYNATEGCHQIEYHSSGEPHLHGYAKINLSPKHWDYSTTELLRMIARSLFLKMPKSAFKQFARAEINEYYKRFRSPAVTINVKTYLSTEWLNYMNKNVEKKVEKK